VENRGTRDRSPVEVKSEGATSGVKESGGRNMVKVGGVVGRHMQVINIVVTYASSPEVVC
jgi:hypothetical protein